MRAAFPDMVLPEPVVVDIDIHVSGEIAVSPHVARRRVTRFVVSHVGNLLCTDEPELVVGPRFVWRVPVMLSSPSRGIIGQVGTVSVDAQTGELDIDPTLIERLQRNARSLAAGPPLPAN